MATSKIEHSVAQRTTGEGKIGGYVRRAERAVMAELGFE